MKDFIKEVDDLTVEYLDYYRRHRSSLTCEFSTSSENFEEKVDYLMKKDVDKCSWKLFKCDTCKGYDKDKPWHVHLVSSLDWDEQYQLLSELRNENHTLRRESSALLKEVEGKEFYPKGTLNSFVDLFEKIVPNPQQYPEYVRGSFIGDTASGMLRWLKGSTFYEESAKVLESMLEVDEDPVKFSQSRDITIDERGNSGDTMFSEVNMGCCGYVYVNLTQFTQKIGKRLRVTVGVL